MTAWRSVGSGRHPFQLRGAQLAAAAAAIPSVADLAASLDMGQLLASAQHSGSERCSGTGAGADDAGSASRAAGAAGGAPRRPAPGKRPRIKGRFVSRAEFARAKATRIDAVAAAADKAATRP